jgi:hypothetical protein
MNNFDPILIHDYILFFWTETPISQGDIFFGGFIKIAFFGFFFKEITLNYFKN